jgi:hypothetical protein
MYFHNLSMPILMSTLVLSALYGASVYQPLFGGMCGGGYGSMNYGEIAYARRHNRRGKIMRRYRHG